MILPTSALTGVLLLVIGLLCWGLWANTFKAAGKWRYEFYYIDFAIGVLICAAIAAFTLGSWDSKELTFQDNFLIAGYRRIATGLAAGLVFGLANTLLLASLSVSGMAVAFSISMGFAIAETQITNALRGAQSLGTLRLGGSILFVLAAVLISAAHVIRQGALAEAGKKEPFQPDPRSKQAKFVKKPSRIRGVILAIVSGIAMGFVNPMIDFARDGESGVGPYGLAILVAAGLLVITLFLSPFVINFPAAGMPVTIRDYFRGKSKQHLLGAVGGAIWGLGMVAYFVAMGSIAGAQVIPTVRVALSESPALLAALVGLTVWREFGDAPERARSLLWGFLVAFIAALVMISVA